MSLWPKFYVRMIYKSQDISKKVSRKLIFTQGRFSLKCNGQVCRKKSPTSLAKQGVLLYDRLKGRCEEMDREKTAC